MIRIDAPYKAVERISFMPNPDFTNEEGYSVTAFVNRAVDGTIYSYIRRPDTDTKILSLGWTRFGRGKMLELIELLREYAGDYVKLTDHLDRVWKVIISNNDTTFTIDGRTFPCGGGTTGRHEGTSFGLQFIGEIVS